MSIPIEKAGVSGVLIDYEHPDLHNGIICVSYNKNS